MNPRAASTTTATVAWFVAEDTWTLRVSGDWRAGPPPAFPAGPPLAEGLRVHVDAEGITHWGLEVAAALWHVLAPLRRQGVELGLESLPAGMQAALELALPHDDPRAEPVPEEPDPLGLVRALKAWWADAMVTVAFVGEVLLACLRLLQGRAVMRVSDLARQVDQTGPLSLPIVVLTSFLIGLMLAYMGGAQLQRIGAQSFIADVVTVGVVREMAGLMMGVILAGRIGAAFAAQLGTMNANEEIDALRSLGVDPVQYLVLPRLLGLLAISPMLWAFAALVGVIAGLPPAVGIYGVPAYEYLHKCREALNWTHLWIGLFKAVLYTILVALAGCREGLHAGRNAQAVGAATTTAVVKALVWIVMAASATTAVFQSLGF